MREFAVAGMRILPWQGFNVQQRKIGMEKFLRQRSSYCLKCLTENILILIRFLFEVSVKYSHEYFVGAVDKVLALYAIDVGSSPSRGMEELDGSSFNHGFTPSRISICARFSIEICFFLASLGFSKVSRRVSTNVQGGSAGITRHDPNYISITFQFHC